LLFVHIILMICYLVVSDTQTLLDYKLNDKDDESMHKYFCCLSDLFHVGK